MRNDCVTTIPTMDYRRAAPLSIRSGESEMPFVLRRRGVGGHCLWIIEQVALLRDRTGRRHDEATPTGVRPVSAFAEPWLRQSERPGDYSTDLVRRTCIDPARSPRTGNCETIANLNCTRQPHTEIHGSGKVVSNLNAVIY